MQPAILSLTSSRCCLAAVGVSGLVIVSMCPLYRGCTVVTMSKFEPVAFLETMQTYRISIAYLVPPIILFLTKHPLVAKYDLGVCVCWGGWPCFPVIVNPHSLKS